jgi:hypothetical protein
MVGVGDESKKVIPSATVNNADGENNQPNAAFPTKVMVRPSHSTADAKPQATPAANKN